MGKYRHNQYNRSESTRYSGIDNELRSIIVFHNVQVETTLSTFLVRTETPVHVTGDGRASALYCIHLLEIGRQWANRTGSGLHFRGSQILWLPYLSHHLINNKSHLSVRWQ